MTQVSFDGRPDPGGGGGAPKSGSTTFTTIGGSPGLLTSTGGLFGSTGVLLTPVLNIVTGNSYILLMDSSNFNCEEDAEYDFPQEIPPREAPQEGHNVTCHLIKLKYRELGACSFSINVTIYIRDTDEFKTLSFPVSIPPIALSKNRKKTFPDKRIHTLYIPMSDVTGERPQTTITRYANSGPISITSLTVCGNADEMSQM